MIRWQLVGVAVGVLAIAVTVAELSKSGPPALVRAQATAAYRESIVSEWRDPNPAWSFCRRGHAWVAMTTERTDGHWYRLVPVDGGYRLDDWGSRDPTFPKLDSRGERLCDE